MVLDDAVIDDIYAAITDDQAFGRLPARLAEVLQASSVWFLRRREAESLTVIDASAGVSDAQRQAYEAGHHKRDPYMARYASAPFETAFSFARLMHTPEMRRGTFHTDYVTPHRLGDHAMGVFFAAGNEIVAVILRSHNAAFEHDDEAALQTIVPHLRRLFVTRHEIASVSHRLALPGALFEETNVAVLLCDSSHIVVHLNRSARNLPADCATINRLGKLVFKTRAAEEAFGRVMDPALRSRGTNDFYVEREDLLPYRVEVREGDHQGPTLPVLIYDLERQLRDRIERAQMLYRFTPSECALAESLLRGNTPEQHATLRGTSIATVRSQLHVMLGKSGTARQAELVALLSR